MVLTLLGRGGGLNQPALFSNVHFSRNKGFWRAHSRNKSITGRQDFLEEIANSEFKKPTTISSSDEDGQPPVKLVKIGDLDSAAQVIEGAKSTIMILNEEVRKAKQEVNTQKGLRAKDLDKYTKEVERKKEEDRRKEERHQKDKNLYLKEISWWKENSIKKSDFLKGLEKLKEKAPGKSKV